MIDNYHSAVVQVEQLQSVNKKLVEVNNTLITERNVALENRKLTEEQAESIISAYNKLPWVVKKFYGVN
jgi:D-tyrosyl-tRNA(Tyr) deacylase